MHKGPALTTALVLITGIGACYFLWQWTGGHGGHAHLDGAHGHNQPEDEPARGPHGGRLLTDGPFTCELTIFERGVPPELRVYCAQAGKPVDPAAVQLAVELRRLLGRVDAIRFVPEADYLRGDRTVDEPHSFDVKVTAEHAGARHQWEYATYEGRVALSPELARASGVVVEPVGPAVIRTSLALYGKLVPDADRVAHVGPRFPGVVKETSKRLGDLVAKGEILAVVQSNDSLQTYAVPAPIAGTVIQKHVTAGEVVHEDDELFVVCDLATVWATFEVPSRDAARVAAGQAVAVRVEGEPGARSTVVSFVAPIGSEASQTVTVRAELQNGDGKLRPGLFVAGELSIAEANVPVAVRVGALQEWRGWDVIFLNDGSVFEAQPVRVGRRDAERVEVLSGAEPGWGYAAAGGFLLKADLGKSGASHDH